MMDGIHSQYVEINPNRHNSISRFKYRKGNDHGCPARWYGAGRNPMERTSG